LIGTVLPGPFDDEMRVAVVRRYPGCPAGVRSLCLSLAMLGLIDSVALAPLALAAALLSSGGIGVRAGLAVVVAAGVAAATLILALPRLVASERILRFRVGRWLAPRTTSRRLASEAWLFVSACWAIRAIAVFLLLGDARDRILLAARPAFPLCRRGGGSSADRPSGCGHAGRRRRRSVDGRGCGRLSGRGGGACRRSTWRSHRRRRRAQRRHLALRAFADACAASRVS
jgi:hypothetical protein